MHELDLFSKIAQAPLAYLQNWKRSHPNRQAMGYFCSYAPEELIWAMGILPFRIPTGSRELQLADQHLQAYSCQVIRQGLEMGLSGELADLDLILFVQTCDSMQRLSDIFRLNMTHPRHLDLVLPAILDKESAKRYYKQTLASLTQKLNIPLSLENAKQSIALFNEIRELITKISTIHRNNPQLISARDIFNIQKAAQFMDRNVLRENLSSLEKTLNKQLQQDLPTTARPAGYKKIVLSGSVCNFPGLYPLLEENKALVVFSDLCTGDRFFSGQLRSDGLQGAGQWQDDFLQILLQRYVTRINCPCKFSGLMSRAEHLEGLVRQHSADGIIFLTLKFCDPHAFDLPYLHNHLKQRDIPCLFYEIEEMDFPGEQFTTRCQAFLEML